MNRFESLIRAALVGLVIFILFNCQAVKNKQLFQGGFYIKNFKQLQHEYETYDSHAACRENETIASVGAGTGQKEAEISAFVDSINWYIQDIDTSHLNKKNFDGIVHYFTRLKKSPVTGTFHLVTGSMKKTNLPENNFDRVLLINVYHELLYPREILEDIQGILKDKGVLVIMERMGNKRGEVHKDCGKPKLYEPDFLDDMKNEGYFIAKKDTAEKVSNLIFYTFTSVRKE